MILSQGAFRSTQLLQLSNIGEPLSLEEKGIEVVCANPNVGEYLQEHLDVNLSAKKGDVQLHQITIPRQPIFSRI